MTKVAFVSFRLKALDGVSAEAEKWVSVFEEWGCEVHRVAGYIPNAGEYDHEISELSFIDPQVESFTAKAFDPAQDRQNVELEYALLEQEIRRRLLPVLDEIAPDILVAENIFSLPLNMPFTVVLCKYLEDANIPCFAVHHDFHWQDPKLRDCVFGELLSNYFPASLPNMQHVTINEQSREELFRLTGVAATCIHNCFDFDEPRQPDEFNSGLRPELGLDNGAAMFLQPTRAIERKGIGKSIKFVEDFASVSGRPARLVVTGPCEQGYEGQFDHMCSSSKAGVLHVPNWLGSYRNHPAAASPYSVRDAYAVCDMVTFPSSREGFGNPVLESVVHRKLLLVADYPVLEELREFGFQFLALDDRAVDRAVKMLEYPQIMQEMVDRNFEIGKKHFSMDSLREEMAHLVSSAAIPAMD
ncbi:MAG: glycosyltransferase family 4 protein [Thermoleophilia bacterium]|nr:glycosyltransferase family 4 protein [Thermoleophilia bacterium]